MKMPHMIAVGILACCLAFSVCGCSNASSASSASDGEPGTPVVVEGTSGEGTSSEVEAQLSAKVEASNTVPAGVAVVTADDVANRAANVYLVDTRTPDEFAAGHIPGALNASYPNSTGGPCGSEESAATFRTNWAALDVPKDADIILYCRTGKRASAAASVLLEDGYISVSLYQGSWTDWTSDPSRPVE